MATCPGGLIFHQADMTIAGCTEDEEHDGCRGTELRHEGTPMMCTAWYPYACDHCGIH
jgi:hypothetical protein